MRDGTLSDVGVPQPGVVVIWDGGGPACRPARIDGAPASVGSTPSCDIRLDARDIAPVHAWLQRERGHLVLTNGATEVGSRVDGRWVTQRTPLSHGQVLRLGDALLLVSDDVRPFERHPVTELAGRVAGPALAPALEAVRRHARDGSHVLLVGEMGTGKGLLGRSYHDARPGGARPFVSAMGVGYRPDEANVELFGATTDVFSPGEPAIGGRIAEADGGTLFLDYIDELPLETQASLARVLEMHCVVAVGSDAPRPVDVAFVAATFRDLRALTAAGAFHAPLLGKLEPCTVELPPLRERREEIPWLLVRGVREARDALARVGSPAATRAAALNVSASVIEAALVQDWEVGNARTLLDASESALRRAIARGADTIRPEHLPVEHGTRRPREVDPYRPRRRHAPLAIH
jgi:DNA-binding NtrC family response regulator